ncbi:MAG TPA: DUF4159 domain-containing protein [Longimicrobiales bacterium]|nr:DUF4159 domain-containing protein [Longimicrobiales bacterium]
MRTPSRASSTLAVLVVSACAAACDTPENEVPAPPGSGVMAQQVPPGAPPGIRRPAREDPGDMALRLPPQDEPPGHHAFYWTRAVYSGGRGGWRRGGSWATDFPKGDRQFLVVLRRLVRLDAYPWENAVGLADPNLRRFPLIYAVEVGYMDLTPEEVHGLRDYLNAGGMMVVDDFWGSREWAQFEYNMRRVLPGRPIVELPSDHPMFTTFYDITEIKQVPNVRQAAWGGPTYERDGYTPHVRAILDDHGEIMVLINWNTDLGDAWEWAEDPRYPLEYSTYAYEIGSNMIVYGMSH